MQDAKPTDQAQNYQYMSQATSNPEHLPEVKAQHLPELSQTHRAMNSRYMQKPWTFTIENLKKQQLEHLKQQLITSQNKALMRKLTSIRDRRAAGKSMNIESQGSSLKKTLHGFVRKEHSRVVKQENISIRKRVERRKATIDLKQIEKEWGDKVNIRQFLSKHERGRRASKSIEVSEIDWVHHQRENIVRYNRERDIKGVKVHIMVEEYNHAVLVSGQLREKDVTMAMVIAKDKLITLQQCQGKVENIGKLLDFDGQLNSLYYIPEPSASSTSSRPQESFISELCSIHELKTMRKAIQKQHKATALKMKPPSQTQVSLSEASSGEGRYLKSLSPHEKLEERVKMS